MIERIQAYKASDGTVFASLEDVQRHDLAALLPTNDVLSPGLIANILVDSRAKVLDILTTGPKALPKARAINGGTKKRNKPITVAQGQAAAEQPATSASN